MHFACVSPALLGRYAEIRANAGDPDRDCGKIVTIGELVVLDEIQPESGKPVPAARRHSQNLHVSTSGSNLRCGLCPGNS